MNKSSSHVYKTLKSEILRSPLLNRFKQTQAQNAKFSRLQCKYLLVQCRYNTTISTSTGNETGVARKKINKQLPKQISSILESNVLGTDLHVNNRDTLVEYIQRKPKISNISRKSIVHVLYRCDAYQSVLDAYHLGNGEKNEQEICPIPENLTVDEFKWVIKSLLRTNNSQLDHYIESMITRYSSNPASKKKVLIPLLNSILKEVYDKQGFEIYLHKWIKFFSFMQGHVQFVDRYITNRLYLKPFKFVLNEDLSKHDSHNDKFHYSNVLVSLLNSGEIKNRLLSQFMTTFMSVLINSQEWKFAETIFELKMEKFPEDISVVDLNCSLQIYCHFEKYKKLITTYKKFPHLHDMSKNQFDYLLITLSKLEDWNGLQQQFDALFYIGELPNVIHYGIIMSKVAKTGHAEIVDKLFKQLIDRRLIPTYHILQSLIIATYRAGDHFGLLKNFQLFEKYEVEPTATTYLYMLKSFRRKNDIEGCLKVLKNIDRSIINESHFLQIILISFAIKNYKIAEEILYVMSEDFKIPPSLFFLSKIMQVYNGCGEPEKALEFFKERHSGDESTIHETPKIISLYNQKLYAHILMKDEDACEQVLQTVQKSGLPIDPEFNFIMLKYFLNIKKNVSLSFEFIKKSFKSNSRMVQSLHLEELMKTIDFNLSSANVNKSVSMIFDIYKFQLDERIPVNSTILKYVIKYAYIHNISKFKSGSQLDQFVILVKSFIDKFHDKSLDTTDPILHPKILYFPIKMMSSVYPQGCKELIEYYLEKIYVPSLDKDDPYLEIPFLKAKLFFSFHLSEWENVSYFFDKILENFMKLKKLPYYQDTETHKCNNLNIKYQMIDIFDIKLRQLEKQNQLSVAIKYFHTIKNDLNLVISNSSCNLLMKLLVSRGQTIEQGLEMCEKYLIKGYQTIHKLRHLRTLKKTVKVESKTLEAYEENPKLFQPVFYLESGAMDNLVKSMDTHLIELDNIVQLQSTIDRWCGKYPKTMVRYLMKPRQFPYWIEYETNNREFLNRVRREKRIEIAK